MNLHPKQQKVVRSKKRFKTIRAGRKGGKTALEVEIICYKALIKAEKLNLTKTKFPSGRKVLYIAPTKDQARNIIWEALKRRLHGIGTPNEQMLQMKVKNEDGDTSTIFVGGWENRENYRGFTDVVHITFDEVDTLKHFFIAWLEIFRPMFLDTGGSADFVGTPKKESGNLKRLEKELAERSAGDYEGFHFTSKDNPFLATSELYLMEKEYQNDPTAYRQEILAEYIENAGSLFRFESTVDIFTNTVAKTNQKYLIVDVADDGSDKTIFSFWNGLEEFEREHYSQLNTEGIISQIRESAAKYAIPYSHIAVDAIGVGAAIASSSFLSGIIGFKSSYAPIKTDLNPVRLPNVGYVEDTPFARISDYKNLRSQCIFTLAQKVNDHEISSKVVGRGKENIIEELAVYQDVSTGDGKRMATMKDDVKSQIGRSPDDSDCFVAGTKVDTPKGKVDIECLKAGDIVSTPFGDTKVKELIQKTTSELITFDNILIGTGNHKLFSGSRFNPIDSYKMCVYNYYITSGYNKFIWKVLSSLSTKVKNIGFRVLVNTSITHPMRKELDKEELLYIERFGKTKTEEKSLLASIYTILTIIILTTTRLIWFVLNLVSIIANMLNSIGEKKESTPQLILTKLEKKHLSGIDQKREDCGTPQCQKNHGVEDSKKTLFARVVRKIIKGIEKVAIATTVACKSLIIEIRNITKIGNVSFVDYLLVSGSLNKPSVVQSLVRQNTDGTKVYTLSLENHHVYIANDILVANCFIMRMYFVIMEKMLPQQSEQSFRTMEIQNNKFMANRANMGANSSK